MENDTGQRQFPRITAVHSMLVEQLDDSQTGDFATSRTVSVGGCGFLTDERFEPGSMVKVMITVGAKVVSARARVAYQQSTDEGRLETGVEFLDLSDDDRALIESLMTKAS